MLYPELMFTNESQYNDLDQFHQNAQLEIVPTEQDKKNLLYQINQLLDTQEHLFIYRNVLNNMDPKIYTMTESAILFDLNDMPPKFFWELGWHTNLFIKAKQRKTEMVLQEQEHQQNLKQLEKNIHQQLTNKISEFENVAQTQIEENGTLDHYAQNRIDTLSTCHWSTYSPNRQVNDLTSLDLNSSDRSYQHLMIGDKKRK